MWPMHSCFTDCDAYVKNDDFSMICVQSGPGQVLDSDNSPSASSMEERTPISDGASVEVKNGLTLGEHITPMRNTDKRLSTGKRLIITCTFEAEGKQYIVLQLN